MTDVHTIQIRSYNMSCIRSKDTKPELVVRKYLFSKGLRYRLHLRRLPGRPDIVLPKYKTVVFVHGCFWHGHAGCKDFVIPKTKTEWWLKKINRNRQNDKLNFEKLLNLGWSVLVIYECDLKKRVRDKTLDGLLTKILNSC